MKNFYDVQQLLKQFGIYVYMGNRQADCDAMEEEIKEIYAQQLITSQDYQQAILIIRHARRENL